MTAQLKTLYRPVGQAEMELIRATQFREFPPRLPEQPIFYPVLTEEMRRRLRAIGIRRMSVRDSRDMFCDFRCERSFSPSTIRMSSEARDIANIGFLQIRWRN